MVFFKQSTTSQMVINFNAITVENNWRLMNRLNLSDVGGCVFFFYSETEHLKSVYDMRLAA